MRLILVPWVFLFVLLSIPCFAQNNQTESLTITTYYPVPAGVYKNLQLTPSTQPSFSDPANHLGTMYFDRDEQKPYLYINNGTAYRWERIGSGGGGIGSGWKVTSAHHISPFQCDGTKIWEGMLLSQCSTPFYDTILFPENYFSEPPLVIVEPEYISNVMDSPCTKSNMDRIWINVTEVNSTGFKLEASGSPLDHDYGDCPQTDYFSRAEVGWMAIGE